MALLLRKQWRLRANHTERFKRKLLKYRLILLRLHISKYEKIFHKKGLYHFLVRVAYVCMN